MDTLNACGECGYTTKDLSDFTKHVQFHEDSPQKMDQHCGLAAPNPALLTNLLSQLPFLGNAGSPMGAGMSLLKAAKSFEPPQASLPLGLGQLFPAMANADMDNFLRQAKLFAQQTHLQQQQQQQQHEQAASPVADDLKEEPSLVHSPPTPTTTHTNNNNNNNGRTANKKVVHSCPHCNFTTVMSQHMKSHLEAHARHQGQMYQCDICHMQFSQKANMHRHRMRHSGQKPYECRFCKKKFFRKDQMQEHSMTHIKTGENFDCPVAGCAQRFRMHSALRTHLDEQHTISSQEHASCKRCAMTFANSRRLLLHYQTKHDENVAGVKREHMEPTASTAADLSDEDSHLSATASPPAKRAALGAHSPMQAPTTTPAHAFTAQLLQMAQLQQQQQQQAPVFNPFGLTHQPGLGAAFGWPGAGLNPLGLADQLRFGARAAHASSRAASPTTTLLPKSKSPLIQLGGADLADGHAMVNKLMEDIKRYQPTAWSQAQRAHADDDHSSTHSPTTDSRASSTPPPTEPEEPKKAARGDANTIAAAPLVDHLLHHDSSTRSDTSKSSGDEPPDPLRLDCAHCGLTFDDPLLHMFHKNLHAADSPWKCGLCEKQCADRFAFTTHLVQDKHLG